MWCVQLNTQTTYYLLFKNIPWDWDRLLYLEIECFVTVTVICLLVCLCMIERLDVWSSYCVIATETLAGSEVIFVIRFSSGVCSCAEHWIKKVCLFTCDQMTFVNKRWILPNVFFFCFYERGNESCLKGLLIFLYTAYLQAPSCEGDCCTISSKGIMIEQWVLVLIVEN